VKAAVEGLALSRGDLCARMRCGAGEELTPSTIFRDVSREATKVISSNGDGSTPIAHPISISTEQQTGLLEYRGKKTRRVQFQCWI